MTDRIIIKTTRVGVWGKESAPKINYSFTPQVRKGDKVRLINILKEKITKSSTTEKDEVTKTAIKIRLDSTHIAHKDAFGYVISKG
jgi:hypothetical protein